MARRRFSADAGFTLLEVILAVGILAVALAVVGEVTRLSHRNAEHAALESDAVVVAESVVAQIVAGLVEPVDIPATAWMVGDETPSWRYSVTTEPSDLPELLQARVRVEEAFSRPDPIAVELVRWVLDPSVIAASESASESASGASL